MNQNITPLLRSEKSGGTASLLRKMSISTGLALLAGSSLQATTDYGPAIWRPAPSGRWYSSGYGKKFYVVHDMEGYYLSTISYLQGNSTSVSVHYCSSGKSDYSGDAPGGEITQMVSDSYYAWTSACWNQHSMSTEHEGFRSNPAWYTPAMYDASSALTRSKAEKYGFAKDRNHVVGHDAKISPAWVSWAASNLGINPTCNTHNDPGPYWDWNGYMARINPPPPPTPPSSPMGGATGQRTKGDFNGDGLEDVAMIYNYGGGVMKIWIFPSTGSSFSNPGQLWYSNNGGWDASKTRWVTGDFNGDGKSDICGFYNYGSSNTKLWVFLSNGNGFSSINVWYTNNGGWNWDSSPDILAGDFNGDGKDDICMPYNYGGYHTKVWVFLSTGSAFPTGSEWYINNGGWDNNVAKWTVGDFNGDGKSDVLASYNYGNGVMRLWTFLSTGYSFPTGSQWHFNNGGWDSSRSKLVAGDFNGDGKCDVAMPYNYGYGVMRLWVYLSTGSSFPSTAGSWHYNNGGWEDNLAQWVAGDFNGDGKKDMTALFDYGSSRFRLWTYLSTGASFPTGEDWHFNNGGWYVGSGSAPF